MLDLFLNQLLFRKYRVNRAKRRLIELFETELSEDFLEVLLKLMKLMFYIDKSFRRNIENFNATYMFRDKGGNIMVSAVFKNSKLTVKKKKIDPSHITIIFKNQKALMNFLVLPKVDILNAILNQDVTYEGNLNYLSKFAYMATHLRLMLIES